MIRDTRLIINRLLGSVVLSTLTIAAGCAWIPKGGPPAKYLEPPE